MASKALIVDACRHVVRDARTVVSLARRPVLFAVARTLGEAWREMRVSSITDIILMKLLRVKQIEDNKGKTLVSEGVQANYQDMINYSVFALIKLAEGQ